MVADGRVYKYEEIVEVAASRRRAIMRVLMRLREEQGGSS